MQKMNIIDRDDFLADMIIEGEEYQAKVWAVIMSVNNSSESAIDNLYCYMGLSKESINFVIVNTFNVSKSDSKISIPLKTVNKVVVKKSFIPKRRVIIIEANDIKLKVSVMLTSFGGDILDQEKNAHILIEELNKIDNQKISVY